MDKIMKNKQALELLTFLFELQTCLKKLIFWSGPLNLETGKERKKKHWISQEQKKLVRENKNLFFIIFETLFLVKSKKMEVNPNCPGWGHIVPNLSVFWPLCFNGKSFETLTFPLILYGTYDQ